MLTVDEIGARFGVSENSAKLYLRSLTSLGKKLTEDEMKDPAKVLKTIAHLKPNTQRTYLLATMRGLKLTKEEADTIGKAYVKMTRTVDTERNTKTRDVPDINFKRKLRILNDKINDATNEKELAGLLQDKLIVLVHSEIPVRRAMDYYDMEIVAEPTKKIISDPDMKGNYYNMRDFIFQKYKTSKKHGTQTLKPTKRIQRTARMLLDLRGDDIGEYLFVNRNGKKFSNPIWNKTLQRVLGVSTNTLRKVYTKQNIDTEAVKKALQIAEDMGHSIETANRDYYERDGDSKKKDETE